ncbi:MAG: SMP-30/gluconolactonase/LRE family protein [Phycisphaeraceae bacterium]
MRNVETMLAAVAMGFLCLLSQDVQAQSEATGTFGAIERLDDRLDALLADDAEIEILAEGFRWSEGPVWVSDGGYVLLSDIPRNTIYRWKEGAGLSVFMQPSGFTGEADGGREPGSNGLAIDAEGHLVLCEHGDRRVSRLVSLDEPNGEKVTLADRYDGKRFNSPNDLAIHSNGAIYFTDPPYGLARGINDPSRELDFHGVYRIDPDGTVTLLTKEIDRPNGIAFSPDQKTLYVANSDRNRAIWMAYDVQDDGSIANGRVFFDATELATDDRPGSPDGLKVDQHGNLFATGPGGVLIISPDGTHLGTILTGRPTANCAFGEDGSTLYITANQHLIRLRTTTTGTGF